MVPPPTHSGCYPGQDIHSLRRPDLPDAFVPYAERLFKRFPEVMLTLGDPQLSEASAGHWGSSTRSMSPSAGCSSRRATVRIDEHAGQKTLQVQLGQAAGGRTSSYPSQTWTHPGRPNLAQQQQHPQPNLHPQLHHQHQNSRHPQLQHQQQRQEQQLQMRYHMMQMQQQMQTLASQAQNMPKAALQQRHGGQAQQAASSSPHFMQRLSAIECEISSLAGVLQQAAEALGKEQDEDQEEDAIDLSSASPQKRPQTQLTSASTPGFLQRRQKQQLAEGRGPSNTAALDDDDDIPSCPPTPDTTNRGKPRARSKEKGASPEKENEKENGTASTMRKLIGDDEPILAVSMKIPPMVQRAESDTGTMSASMADFVAKRRQFASAPAGGPGNPNYVAQQETYIRAIAASSPVGSGGEMMRPTLSDQANAGVRATSSLGKRRQVAPLTLRPNPPVAVRDDGQNHRRGSKQGMSGYALEHQQSAVVLIDKMDKEADANGPPSRSSSPPDARRPVSLRRPLPAAFPHRRTVIVFDWDNTLCPTTWIRSLLKERVDELHEMARGADSPRRHTTTDWLSEIPAWFGQPLPDEPAITEAIEALQSAVIEVLNVAMVLGVVCIVTNAVPGWVDKTISRWLPKLKQHIHGHGFLPPIKIFYGHHEYQQAKWSKASANEKFVCEFDEQMWWKKAAMTHAMEKMEELSRADYARRRGDGRLGLMSDTPLAGEAGSSSLQPPEKTKPSATPSGSNWPAAEEYSWCHDRLGNFMSNIIAIGDDEAEMEAATLLGHQHPEWQRSILDPSRVGVPPRSASDAPPQHHNHHHPPRRGRSGSNLDEKPAQVQKRACRRPLSTPPCSSKVKCSRQNWQPWVKLIKLAEYPTIDQVRQQLEEVATVLPQLVALRTHSRLDMEATLTSQSGSMSLADFDASMQSGLETEVELGKALRTQTV